MNNKENSTDLITSTDDVYVWYACLSMRNELCCNIFDSFEDAKEYVRENEDMDAALQKAPIAYTIGTKAEYDAACIAYKREGERREEAAYAAHVDKETKRLELEIVCLDTLLRVCKEFDGQILDKRFHAAIESSTGFFSGFKEDCFKLLYSKNNHDYDQNPSIEIGVDWSHGYDSFGRKSKIHLDAWRWNNGERLEADKVAPVLDNVRKIRLRRIRRINATKKKYREYLRQARQVEQMIFRLNDCDRKMQDWAMEHDLDLFRDDVYIFKKRL